MVILTNVCFLVHIIELMRMSNVAFFFLLAVEYVMMFENCKKAVALILSNFFEISNSKSYLQHVIISLVKIRYRNKRKNL
jgi:hypothetical protein